MQSTTTPESAPVALRADADSEPSTAGLVASMAVDVKHLGESYLEMLRLELARALRTMAEVVAAGVLAVLGVALIAVGAALALHDHTELSLGGAYEVVGGVLGIAGIVGLVVTAMLRRKDAP